MTNTTSAMSFVDLVEANYEDNTVAQPSMVDTAIKFIGDNTKEAYGKTVHTIGGVVESTVQCTKATPAIFKAGRESSRQSTKDILAKYIK